MIMFKGENKPAVNLLGKWNDKLLILWSEGIFLVMASSLRDSRRNHASVPDPLERRPQ